jgi:hypothetical protein
MYYGLKGMEEEQGLLIKQKKFVDAGGIEPSTSR